MSEQSEIGPEPIAAARVSLPRRATLRDVALRAGVSTAAASKVLRGAYGVSPAMRERVQDAITALAYRPNVSARGMRGKTFTVGVLVSDIQNQFYNQVLSGVAPVFAETDYAMLIGQGEPSTESEVSMVEAMIDHRMDGLVLMTPTMPTAELERFATVLPVVVAARGGRAIGFDTVATDDAIGSALIVDHLVGLGHRAIAHVTVESPDDDPNLPFRARARGYVEAMRRHGLEDEIDIVSTSWTTDGGAEAARRLLDRRRLPTAVHAGADVAALGLLGVLWDRGIDVPGDLSVVGYDNSPIGMLAPVSLTSVDQAAGELGRRAAELLLERIAGRSEPRSVLLQPTLVTRRTTTVPRSDAGSPAGLTTGV